MTYGGICWEHIPAAPPPGMPTFLLARVMGCSLQMIDRHYGHLARDSEDKPGRS
jgi:hypothetical protein